MPALGILYGGGQLSAKEGYNSSDYEFRYGGTQGLLVWGVIPVKEDYCSTHF